MSTRSASFKESLLAVIPNLRAFAVSLCGDRERADDLVQETLLKAWDHSDSFEEGTNLRAWLFTILRNSYFSDCRRRRREAVDGLIAGRSRSPFKVNRTAISICRTSARLWPVCRASSARL
jgi:RNA polymerase sigma factor (sigma-70 family)